MRKTFLPLAVGLALSALSAHADYLVSFSVDTHTLAGTSGNVDFQFNPGPLTTQSASVNVQKFAGATYLAGSQVDTGGVTGGPLPGTVVISNSTIFNDDFEGVKFGNTLAFILDFTGPAINAPSGTALSGSSFAFSLYDSTGTNPLLTSDPNGFAAVVNISNKGVVTTLTPSSSVTVTPEPSTLLMLGGSLLALGIYRKSR